MLFSPVARGNFSFTSPTAYSGNVEQASSHTIIRAKKKKFLISESDSRRKYSKKKCLLGSFTQIEKSDICRLEKFPT